MFKISPNIIEIETNHGSLRKDILYELLTKITTILLMDFCREKIEHERNINIEDTDE